MTLRASETDERCEEIFKAVRVQTVRARSNGTIDRRQTTVATAIENAISDLDENFHVDMKRSSINPKVDTRWVVPCCSRKKSKHTPMSSAAIR